MEEVNQTLNQRRFWSLQLKSIKEFLSDAFKGIESATFKVAVTNPDTNLLKEIAENTRKSASRLTKIAELLEEEEEMPYTHSSTQVNIAEPLASKIRLFGAKISEKDLCQDEECPKREDQPHITVKYGLLTTKPSILEALLKPQKPVKATLQELSVFETPKYDVLKIGVESKDLHALNKVVCESGLQIEDEYPKYVPHVTIAYVKKGKGKAYVGNPTFKGIKAEFDEVQFCSCETGEQTPIPLEGKA